MPILSAIFSSIGGPIVDALLGNVRGIFEAYFKKEISEAQLREQLMAAIAKTFSEIEVAHAEALAKTYASFMEAMSKSPIMQRAWSIVVYSQLFVLVWHQMAIPFIVFTGLTAKYPPSGSTGGWAYLLLAACMGMGPVVRRAGPGGGNLAERLKGLVGR